MNLVRFYAPPFMCSLSSTHIPPSHVNVLQLSSSSMLCSWLWLMVLLHRAACTPWRVNCALASLVMIYISSGHCVLFYPALVVPHLLHHLRVHCTSTPLHHKC